MYNHQLVTFKEKSTQYRISDTKIKEHKSRSPINQIPKIENVIQILDLDKSERKLREDMEIENHNENEERKLGEDMKIQNNQANEDAKPEMSDFSNVSKHEITDFTNRIQEEKQIKFKKG